MVLQKIKNKGFDSNHLANEIYDLWIKPTISFVIFVANKLAELF